MKTGHRETMGGCSLLLLVLLYNAATISALTTAEKNAFAAAVVLEENSDVYKFFSSGYPPHEVDNSVNPNAASVQNFTYNISVTPDNTGDTVWCTSLGPVGFATNGVAIYNALTGETTDAVRYEIFDNCKGHSSPDGAYHYHQFPVCVGTLETVDLFVGIALDGNPIYGPKASDKTELLTSADLDACHGRYVNGNYRYHITADFPYVIGCYKAEPAASAMVRGPPGGGQRPGQGGPPGQGAPPGRKRRQTNPGTCTNTDSGGHLCDCTSGTLTQCDTLTGNDACSTSTPTSSMTSTTTKGSRVGDSKASVNAASSLLVTVAVLYSFC